MWRGFLIFFNCRRVSFTFFWFVLYLSVVCFDFVSTEVSGAMSLVGRGSENCIGKRRLRMIFMWWVRVVSFWFT